jgi:hypothetical protein
MLASEARHVQAKEYLRSLGIDRDVKVEMILSPVSSVEYFSVTVLPKAKTHTSLQLTFGVLGRWILYGNKRDLMNWYEKDSKLLER